uniref:Reverse transcriptase domain-containing protein n=1 Tax=Tanacetum cinerariifolium TaxID=118510 RepID=A0A6L2NC79_TANCI|nr:hypothetical protein [Tanacetum cinerariifolium]
MSSSMVTDTSISSDSELPPWGFHLLSDVKPQLPEAALQSLEQAPLSPDYVPGPEYPEYLAPFDDEIPVEDPPLPADALPTALSLGYIADFDHLEEDPDEDPADYLVDARDDGQEEEDSFKDNEDEEKDEHLALTDSTLPVINFIPLAEETKPFETNDSAATPPPPQTIVPVSMTRLHRAWIFVRPHTPPSPSTEALIVEFKVGESSRATATGQKGHTLARRIDYEFIDTLDASIRPLRAWSRSEDISTALEDLIMTQEAYTTSLEAQKMALKKTTTPMNDAAIKQLISQGVADALVEYEATETVEMAMIAMIREVAEGQSALLVSAPIVTS